MNYGEFYLIKKMEEDLRIGLEELDIKASGKEHRKIYRIGAALRDLQQMIKLTEESEDMKKQVAFYEGHRASE
jgi:hypothetical protein